MKKLLLYTGLLLASVSCIYPYDPDLQDAGNRSVVIEGNILIGDKSTAYLSYTIPLSGQLQGYPAGTGYIEDDKGGTYSMITGSHTVQGYQIDFNTANAAEDRKYRMVISVDGLTYRTEWITPEKSPVIGGVSFKADESQVYAMVSFKDSPGGSGYFSVSCEETWHFHADYERTYYLDLSTLVIVDLQSTMGDPYWCWKSFTPPTSTLVDAHDTNGEVKDLIFKSFPRTDNRNHDRYRVKVKVRNMSENEYKFRKLLDQNEDVGGNLFTPEPGEMIGNIACVEDPSVRVYGYVYASSVTEGTYYFNSPYYIISRYVLIKVEDTAEEYIRYSGMGFQPVTDYYDNDESFIGWGPERCYDCTAAGGTRNKPEDWEEK